jgi:hypothetical protein
MSENTLSVSSEGNELKVYNNKLYTSQSFLKINYQLFFIFLLAPSLIDSFYWHPQSNGPQRGF